MADYPYIPIDVSAKQLEEIAKHKVQEEGELSSGNEIPVAKVVKDYVNKFISSYSDATYANAIKGSVRLDTLSSNDREIILTDVSPIEHELNFRITSDIINVSGLTFLKSGKNLCPAPESGATTTEVFKLPYQSWANNQYTFSTNASGWYGILWEGGKSANVPTTFHNGETFTLTSANDEITVEGSNKWLGDGYYVQIERGTAATDYEEYSELQTVTTNSDGTVDGLISVSPTTVIERLPPDSIISCEYNRDINAVIGDFDKRLSALEVQL